jgi:homoserine dehydrogenase
METASLDFDAALKEAQELGYAEKDPTADIEGHDPCRKIAILASLVCGKKVDYEQILMEGIKDLSITDIKYAKAADKSIKLIAKCEFKNGNCYSIVSPRMVDNSNPLAMVKDVFNAVLIHSDMLDDSMYYGRGAGRKATASAVVGDAIACAASIGTTIESGLTEELGDLAEIGTYRQRYFVRLKGSKSVRKDEVETALGKGSIVFDIAKDEFGFLMKEEMEEAVFMQKKEQLQGVIDFIRVL